MNRRAGIFEAPPKILADFQRFFSEKWSAYVLELLDKHKAQLVEKRDKAKTEYIKVYRDLKGKVRRNMQGALRRSPSSFILRLPGDPYYPEVRASVGPPTWGGSGDRWQIEVKRSGWEDYSTDLDSGDAERELLSLIDSAADEVIEGPVSELKSWVGYVAPTQREALKSISGTPRWAAPKTFEYRVDDLAGWSPFDRAKQQGAKILQKKVSIRTILVPPEGLSSGKQYAGEWSPSQWELRVKVRPITPDRYDVKRFKSDLHEILRTTRHETQHMGQDLLRLILQLPEDAGLPGYQLRTPGYDPSGSPSGTPGKRPSGDLPLEEEDTYQRILHPLRDVEFYTRLADEVDRFKSWHDEWVEAEKNPDPYHQRPKIPINEGIWRKAIRRWVGYEPSSGVSRRYDLPQTSQFFEELKKWQPDKWKKAVKEFLKALKAKGIRAPSRAEERGFNPLPGSTTKGDIFGKTVVQYSQERTSTLYQELFGEDPPRSSREEDPDKEAAVWRVVRKEYADFVNSASPQMLYRHRQAVFAGDWGREYYLTDRWLHWDGKSDLPEPRRTPDGQTILEDHPKVKKYLESLEKRRKKVASRWIRRLITPLPSCPSCLS